MPARLTKPRPRPPLPPSYSHSKHAKGRPIADFYIDQDDGSDVLATALSPGSSEAAASPRSSASKLSGLFLHGRKSSRSSPSPAPQAAAASSSPVSNMASPANGKSVPSTTPFPASAVPSRMSSTIRTVRRSIEDREHDSELSDSDSTPSLNASRTSAFSSSVNSNASAISAMSQQHASNRSERSPSIRLKQSSSAAVLGGSPPRLEVPATLIRHRSVEMGQPSLEVPQRESSLTATIMHVDGEPQHDLSSGTRASPDASLAPAETHTSNGWDSTVGKAGLGKTGRVINRLVSDNETLKRDIQIERLRAEESKQTARLLEDKMERLISDYESRLLEANVTKTLLARKERQVESLQSRVEAERKRAADATERERMWKEEMERVRAKAKLEVEEATTLASLMEGRYNAISSHWRDQGEEVRKAMSKMRAEISDLVEERRRDDDKIGILRDLCDQQDSNIRELRQQKDEISAQFERYKAEQEEALRAIKSKAAAREEEQERMLKESKEVLDKLRWALNIKENIPWAE
ncbi:hypothetical protein VTK73DRAFT_7013 [Phialemonium thermophilum]|uniref:SWI5-dependent HO expression protein 3 n=1 Tax=Phialemonium thermophilum TaxID=223376 RepID=A0ABR3WH56_9PEZI